MTLPDERTRAIIHAHDFLCRLLDAKQTPRIPLTIRAEASRVLRHFPTVGDLYFIARKTDLLSVPKDALERKPND